MERPPLVARTRVITSVEDQLVELQRDTDVEYYEAKLVAERQAGIKEVVDWIEAHSKGDRIKLITNFIPISEVDWQAKLKEWGL